MILHQQAFIPAATFPNFFQQWALLNKFFVRIFLIGDFLQDYSLSDHVLTTFCIRLYTFPALVSRLLYQGFWLLVSMLSASCFMSCIISLKVCSLSYQGQQPLTVSIGNVHQGCNFATAILSNSDSALLWLKSDSEFPQLWDSSHCPSLTLYPFIGYFPGATASRFILLQSSKKFFTNVTSQICLVFALLHSISPIEACSLSSQAIQPLVLGPAASCCNVTFANVVFFPTFHTVWY